MTVVLFNKFTSRGKYLVGDEVGFQLLNIGALPEGVPGAPAGPRSNSSQQ